MDWQWKLQFDVWEYLHQHSRSESLIMETNPLPALKN